MMPSSPIRWLVVVALGLIACFIASSLYITHKIARIDDHVASIVLNVSPDIAELAAARTEMRHLEMGIGRFMGAHLAKRPFDRGQFARWRAAIDSHLAVYEASPIPGDREVYDELIATKRHVYETIDRVLALVDGGDFLGGRDVLFEELDPAAEKLDRLTELLLASNAAFANQSARQITEIRQRTARVALLLDGLTVLLGLVLLLVAVRAARLYQRAADERRRLAELRAAELDHFAGRVAHDLRGPITALLVNAEMAELQPERTTDLVGKMKRSALLMKEMVDALLDFARSGAQPQKGATTPVAAVLDAVLADVQQPAKQAGTVVKVDPFPQGCSVHASPGVLACVLSNLVHNAVKYIGQDGRERHVTVRVHEDPETVRLEVEDNGPGLPAGMENQVFELYVRAKNAEGLPGLGLGLATVKRLVEAHHGKLGVRPVEGRGACFWVELPRAENAPPIEQ